MKSVISFIVIVAVATLGYMALKKDEGPLQKTMVKYEKFESLGVFILVAEPHDRRSKGDGVVDDL